jgi:hypothetical protein
MDDHDDKDHDDHDDDRDDDGHGRGHHSGAAEPFLTGDCSVPPPRYRRPELPCPWCGQDVPNPRRPGRPRVYCNHSCRQRAYERRKGLGVVPPPDRLIMMPNPRLQPGSRPTGYEVGHNVIGKLHALRPAAVPRPNGQRLTLCGAYAFPGRERFSPVRPRACLTCAKVARLRPSGRPVQVSSDLARMREVLDRAATDRARGQPLLTADSLLDDLLGLA